MTLQRKIKVFQWVMAGVAGLAVLLALALLGLSTWRDHAPVLAQVEMVAPKRLTLGSVVEARVEVDCPYYRLPRLPLTVQPPAGVQLLEGSGRRLVGIGVWGWRWRCAAALQPVELGRHEGGSVAVAFSPGRRGGDDALSAALPALTVEPRPAAADSALALAPLIPQGWLPGVWRWWHYLGMGLLLLILGVAFWLLYRRREGTALPPPVPPWETAQAALQELEAALPLAPEPFFVRYADVLRGYGDARFGLHAAEATTPELLERLRRLPALTPGQRQAVGDVLAAADRIKFACADATQDELRAALAVARRFIGETIPAGGEAPRDAAGDTEDGTGNGKEDGKDGKRKNGGEPR
ncbi:MAG: DUF4381 family protein [Lentisphaeria bacterium]